MILDNISTKFKRLLYLYIIIIFFNCSKKGIIKMQNGDDEKEKEYDFKNILFHNEKVNHIKCNLPRPKAIYSNLDEYCNFNEKFLKFERVFEENRFHSEHPSIQNIKIEYINNNENKIYVHLTKSKMEFEERLKFDLFSNSYKVGNYCKIYYKTDDNDTYKNLFPSFISGEQIKWKIIDKDHKQNILTLDFVKTKQRKIQKLNKKLLQKNLIISLLNNSCMYGRKLKAVFFLRNYEQNPYSICNNNILNLILGNHNKIKVKNKKKRQTSIDFGYNLNASQNQAVLSAKENDITIIQGPPGTGKTEVAAAIVNELRLNRFFTGKIYLGAPSNTATDKLTNTLYNFISKNGNKLFDIDNDPSKLITRIYSNDKNLSDLANISLDNPEIALKNKALAYATEKNLNAFLELHNNFNLGNLTLVEEQKYNRELDKIKKKIIDNSKIIITTFGTAQIPILKDVKFNYIILDEVAQSTESEIILTLKGAEKMILIGDVNQLGPVKHCSNISDDYYTSFFERIFNLTKYKRSKIKPIHLNIQYRMHPMLIQFPKIKFYNNNLKTRNIGIPTLDLDNFWPNNDNPQFFIDTKNIEENQIYTSFVNITEANIIVNIYFDLLNNYKAELGQIGIITPYLAQVQLLKTLIIKRLHDLYKEKEGLNIDGICDKFSEHLKINTVNAFQGSEIDYMIISPVRSNDSSQIGFLNDYKRLNVAITRQKYGLIIVGNAVFLKQIDHYWCDLIESFEDNDLLGYSYNEICSFQKQNNKDDESTFAFI